MDRERKVQKGRRKREREREGRKGVRKTQKGWSTRQMTNCD